MTYESLANRDKVLRNVENLTSTKKDTSDKEGSQFVRNYYQNQLSKERDQHEENIKNLNIELEKAKSEMKKQKLMSMNCEMEIKDLKERNRNLEYDIIEANRKFSECISQIQQAKQKERSLYQESIVRLLNNVEKGRNSNYSSCDGNLY